MIRRLREERLRLYEQAKAILDRAERGSGTMTSPERDEVTRLNARIDELGAEIKARERTDAVETMLSESRGRQTDTTTRNDVHSEDDRRYVDPVYGKRRFSSPADMALRAWALGNRATREMLEAAQRLGVRPGAPELDLRALGSATGSAGGYSVPNEIMRAYHEKLKWFGGVRQVARVEQTESGATLPWPTVDDTANTGEIVAESGPVTTTADPTFGIVNLGAHKFSSKAVIVPVELLQDSFINLPEYLGGALGRRIGRIQNNKFTVGTGTGEPNGIVAASSLGKTAAATNAFVFDEVIDLVDSVDPAYTASPSAGFMFHRTIGSYLRKLKDSQGRYLWEMSLQVGQPDRILGYPVAINNDMASALSTGNKLVLFGDLNAYVVRDAGPPEILRSDHVRIMTHEVVFLAFHRSDGNLPDTTAIKHLKLA